jgi:hypothetical protein
VTSGRWTKFGPTREGEKGDRESCIMRGFTDWLDTENEMRRRARDETSTLFADADVDGNMMLRSKV